MSNVIRRPLAVAIMLLGTLIGVPSFAGCDDRAKPNVDWTKCTKMRLDMRNKDLAGAVLLRTNLSGLQGVVLAQAVIDRARLQEVDLTGSNLTNVQGILTDFQQSNLAGVSLENSELLRANFSNANLENANLSQAELGRAIFTGANLGGANLSFSSIARSTFRGAKLQNVHLLGAYLYLAEFEGVDLSQAIGLTQEQLKLACGDDSTQLPAGFDRPMSWPCEKDD
jgi:uncharacterized protein YjbI with pentapeptide repeats